MNTAVQKCSGEVKQTHYSLFAQRAFSRFELRFDQHHGFAALAEHAVKRGQDQSERNEAQVGGEEILVAVRRKFACVCAEKRDAGVTREFFRKSALPHIDRKHALCPVSEQEVGETAVRAPYIGAVEPRNRESEHAVRLFDFVRALRGVVLVGKYLDFVAFRDVGGRFENLSAVDGDPSSQN